MYSRADCGYLDIQLFGSLYDGHLFSVNDNLRSVNTVPTLLLRSSPSTILRRVISIRIYPVNGCSCWAETHVDTEIKETLWPRPTGTHGYAPPSISGVVGGFRIRATLNHISIGGVCQGLLIFWHSFHLWIISYHTRITLSRE